MARIGKIIEIKILKSKLANGAEIADHVAPILALKNYGDSGFCGTRNALYAGDVHTNVGETLHRDTAKWIISDASDKANAAAERCQVVGGVGG